MAPKPSIFALLVRGQPELRAPVHPSLPPSIHATQPYRSQSLRAEFLSSRLLLRLLLLQRVKPPSNPLPWPPHMRQEAPLLLLLLPRLGHAAVVRSQPSKKTSVCMGGLLTSNMVPACTWRARRKSYLGMNGNDAEADNAHTRRGSFCLLTRSPSESYIVHRPGVISRGLQTWKQLWVDTQHVHATDVHTRRHLGGAGSR